MSGKRAKQARREAPLGYQPRTGLPPREPKPGYALAEIQPEMLQLVQAIVGVMMHYSGPAGEVVELGNYAADLSQPHVEAARTIAESVTRSEQEREAFLAWLWARTLNEMKDPEAVAIRRRYVAERVRLGRPLLPDEIHEIADAVRREVEEARGADAPPNAEGEET